MAVQQAGGVVIMGDQVVLRLTSKEKYLFPQRPSGTRREDRRRCAKLPKRPAWKAKSFNG